MVSALGLGIAYSSRRPEHVLNVPAGRLSARQHEPGDFVAWCRARGIDAHSHAFVERQHFGAYLNERVWERAGRAAVRVEHVRARVEDVVERDGGYLISTADRRRHEADGVVLATGYGLVPGNAPTREEFTVRRALTRRRVKSSWFDAFASFGSADSPLVVRDPYAPDAFAAFAKDGVVMVVGTGLTAVDVILSLAADRPGQPVLAVSAAGCCRTCTISMSNRSRFAWSHGAPVGCCSSCARRPVTSRGRVATGGR